MNRIRPSRLLPDLGFEVPSWSADHSVPESAPELAARAAEHVRLLNHATVIVDVSGGVEAWPGYRTPADVADTVAALMRAVQMLPQALAQADRWLTAALATGRVGDDRRGLLDPALAVAEASSDLRVAASSAELLAHNLRLAHEALAHLTYDLDDQDQGEDQVDAATDDGHDRGRDDTDGGL